MSLKRVPITLKTAARGLCGNYPITQGIPFAEGELDDTGIIRLVSEEGSEIPSQFEPLSSWRSDGKHTKWLLADFVAKFKGSADKMIFLEYENKNGETSSLNNVCIDGANTDKCFYEAEEGIISVYSGAIAVIMNQKAPCFIKDILLRKDNVWQSICRGNPDFSLYITDSRNITYSSAYSKTPPEITIESAGDIRISICIKGRYASENGDSFCQYILRMHVYVGMPYIKLNHTFVFDGDPDIADIKDMGIHLRLEQGKKARVSFGMDDGVKTEELKTGSIELLQSSDLDCSISAEGKPVMGSRASGWTALYGDEIAFGAIIRDIWREYPKAISISRENDLISIADIKLWPASYGKELSFSAPLKGYPAYFNPKLLQDRDESKFKEIVDANPGAFFNLKSLSAVSPEEIEWVEKMMDKYAPGRQSSYNDTGTSNGYGAAKTTEMLLLFSECQQADQLIDLMSDLNEFVQEPPLAAADPGYVCSTGAVRLNAEYREGEFEETEHFLDRIIEEVIVEPRQILRNYGMYNYGDLICSHSPTPGAIYQTWKDSDDIIDRMKRCSKAYNNEANDQLNAVWGFFLHSGKREHFLLAEAFGKHMGDVDFIHAGKSKGYIHYHNAHHWSGGAAHCHSTIAGLMLQYYLTGNRRLYDICLENADRILQEIEPCGIIKNRSGSLVREYTTRIANLLEVYQINWDPKYGETARKSLKWMCLAMPEPGNFMMNIRTGGIDGDEAQTLNHGRWNLRQAGGMTPQLLYDANLLFGDKESIFADTIVGMAKKYVEMPGYSNWTYMPVGSGGIKMNFPEMNLTILAYAYELTEDPLVLGFCKYFLEKAFAPIIEDTLKCTKRGRMGNFTSVFFGSAIPPLIAAVRNAEKKLGSDAVSKAEEAFVSYVEQKYRDKEELLLYALDNDYTLLGIIDGYKE